jgi:hypothetical protein
MTASRLRLPYDNDGYKPSEVRGGKLPPVPERSACLPVPEATTGFSFHIPAQAGTQGCQPSKPRKSYHYSIAMHSMAVKRYGPCRECELQ